MFALVYSSKAVAEFDNEELVELCRISSENNLKLDVTGYLYFRQGKFLQYLEGEENAVTELLSKIQADKRHIIKNVIYDEPIENRRFPDWSMRYLPLDGVLLEDAIQSRMELLKFMSLNEEAERKVWSAVNKLSGIRDLLGQPLYNY